jgi:hypothetical protein
MSLESPVGGSVHAGRSKCALDAQLVLAGLDIIRDLLQIVKALDVVQLVACLFQKADVGDDAIGLDDIGDAVDRIPVLELESIGGQVADNIGAGQVIAVILPVGQADRAVDWNMVGASDLAISLIRVVSYSPEAAVTTVTGTPVSSV